MQLYQLKFPNGKSYIGITSKTAEKRFNQHCLPANNKNACQKAIYKYGRDNVVLTVLATVDNYELLQLAEQEAIEKFNTYASNGKGYNLTLGGGGTIGRLASDETKNKIAKKAIGRKHSLEAKEKVSVFNKGKIVSNETKLKMSAYHTGKKRSEYHCEQLRLGWIKRRARETLVVKDITDNINNGYYQTEIHFSFQQ